MTRAKPALFKTDFFLYFPLKRVAQHAARLLEKRGFQTEIHPSEVGRSWLCLGKMAIRRGTSPDLDQIATYLQRMARRLGGELDGWESDVAPSPPPKEEPHAQR